MGERVPGAQGLGVRGSCRISAQLGWDALVASVGADERAVRPRVRRRLSGVLRFDEHTNVTRRRGFRIGWLLWWQDEPPFHYEWRWFQIHVMTWDRHRKSPALKVQFEIKTYRTKGMRSVDGSKRYVRFGICL